jgi:hypothetical protein
MVTTGIPVSLSLPAAVPPLQGRSTEDQAKPPGRASSSSSGLVRIPARAQQPHCGLSGPGLSSSPAKFYHPVDTDRVDPAGAQSLAAAEPRPPPYAPSPPCCQPECGPACAAPAITAYNSLAALSTTVTPAIAAPGPPLSNMNFVIGLHRLRLRALDP